MSDETEQVESAATEQVQEAAESETPQASAETETTETEESQTENMIPQSRFNEVIGERNDLRTEREALAKRIEALEASVHEPEAKEPETQQADEGPLVPPENLSQDDKVQWLIEQHSERMIKRKLGMGLEDVANVLGTVKETATDYHERRWERECSTRSLDPANADIQKFVAGQIKLGSDLGDAFKDAQRIFGKTNGETKVEPETPAASVEDGGVTGVMTSQRVRFKTAKEASEAASKGIKASELSLSEILNGADEAK